MLTMNDDRTLQGLGDRQDNVAKPAMRRVAVEAAMPQHHRPNARRFIGRRADLQRGVPYELLRDPAAESGPQIRLDKARRRGAIRGSHSDAAPRPPLAEPPVKEA